ncbi:C-C motif chemokine 25b [Paramormyrops kingsleyae]|uniref:C-C motif chemokine 25b n=1 Tax=Paramormyrops kingsleyae TaxID=1676925 RepID=UPI003B96D2AD
MKFSVLFCILLFTCLYLTLAQGSYENCCLKYVKSIRKATRRHVVEYRRQETDGGCNLPAIVFKVNYKGKWKQICADPNKDWVKSLIETIDKPIRQAKN